MFLIGEKGLLKGLRLSFEEGEEWFLGSDSNQATYVLEDSSLAERAVRITKTPEDLFFIENLGSSDSVLVNKRRVETSVLLSEGDQIDLGATTFRFVEQEAPSEQSPYDDIFGSIENPELPPDPEPLEEPEMTSSGEELPLSFEDLEQKEDPIRNAYDTIFEDSGEESDLPFHIIPEQNAPLLLKVIGGPNAGAEIGLEKGRDYVLGKDPNSCDIVFNDLSVSRNHAHLSITSEGILELEDLGSKNGTVVNGSKIAEKIAITTQHLIQMGTTIFLIIDREVAQETIYSPPPAWHHEEQTESAVKEEALVKAKSFEERMEDWKGKKIPTKHLILAGSFLVIFFVISLSFFSLFKSAPIELVHKNPHEHLKEAFEKTPSVQYSYNEATGKIFLTGHVLTNVSHQELLYNLGQLSMISSIDDTITIDETVWKLMNDLLSTNPNWRSVSVLSSEPGRFIARGYVPNAQTATQLGEFFVTNFPYADRFQNQVVVGEMTTGEVLSLLQAQGFGSISSLFSNGELILTGRYSEKQSFAYKELLSRLEKVEGVHLVKNFAVPVSASAASINLSDQYRISGSAFQNHKGYSVVINGRILRVGEALDGMELVSIEPDTILLEKDGLRYKIDYVQ